MDENNILLERLQANDEAAYQELFEIYFKQLHHFAERMVFDSEVAHDLVQDVFISLYENSKKLSARSNLSGWLFVSVRNSCLKYCNKDTSVFSPIPLISLNTLIVCFFSRNLR